MRFPEMDAQAAGLMLAALLGGLAVFLLGMDRMTDALRAVAETRFRRILARMDRSRPAGLAVGTLMGVLAHSSATSVVCVGLVNAGLLTLPGALPPLLGAGIGTSLAMQLMAFDIGRHGALIVALGFVLRLVPARGARDAGGALVGFGLLFLGMAMMREAIEPHRAALTPLLSGIDGRTPAGMLAGIALATLFTFIVQSSGATIGIAFVLCRAGVFRDLPQVAPVILGAQVGTCISALLAAIGASREARRTALAQLLYRALVAALAAAAAPVLLPLLARGPGGLAHQAANLHTVVMTGGAVLVLPFTGLLVRAVRLLTFTRRPERPASFLDDALLARPEQALTAAVRELQRTARLVLHAFRANAVLFLRNDRLSTAAIKRNEDAVDRIKARMLDYVGAVARRRLSRRQALLAQYLERCMIDLERMADHIDAMCDLSRSRRRARAAPFDRATLRQWFGLYREADRILGLVIESLNADLDAFDDVAEDITATRGVFDARCRTFNHYMVEKLALREFSPLTGVHLNQFVSTLQRIVRHADTIAATEQKPEFFIKRGKFDRVAPRVDEGTPPPPEHPEDYLRNIKTESE
jgi:phosphate:Na+ symporter